MRLFDFYCKECDLEFEDLVGNTDEETDCAQCGKKSPKILSAPRIGLYADPKSAATVEALQKRSRDHSIAQARKNPEKIAKQLGGKPAAQSRWNVRTAPKSSKKKND